MPEIPDKTYAEIIYSDDGKTFTVNFHTYFGPINESKIQKPWSRPPIAWEFYPLIGQIATTWGGIEVRMNSLIPWMAKAASVEIPERWSRENFIKRKKLFVDLVKECFKSEPSIAHYLRETVAIAADCHWRRNLIVHGKIVAQWGWHVVSPPEFIFRLQVDGRHNGREVTEFYSLEDLEALFLRIAHTHGRLDFVSGHEMDAPMLSSQDILRLRDFAVGNHPRPPNVYKVGPQPVSLFP